MNDSDLIDVENLDFLDDQVWLHKTPNDRGDRLDVVDWCLSLDWPVYDDEEYDRMEKKLYETLDDILNKQVLAMPDKHKFDSRTYVKPKRRAQRPSIINQIAEAASPPPTSPLSSLNNNSNKFLTYNKYSTPLAPILRHKTFNVDSNADNTNAIKEALKRRSLVQEDDSQLEDVDMTLMDMSDRLSMDQAPTPSKPINIDLSQPAHNLHNTFNKGAPNIMLDRGSLNMYQSGESLMRMSPPSLVSSLMMDSSGTFAEPLDRKSIPSPKDSGLPASNRESIDPMMTSMTLSILDEKDMSTSFLSQTTYPDHDSLMDSLPPSLVSSVNSSYIVKGKGERDSAGSTNNVFSSATFTHLEQSERLLSGRPRCGNMYNSLRSSVPRGSESYTKAAEVACQIDQGSVTGTIDNGDKGIKDHSTNGEQITLHYSNTKFRRTKGAGAGKENVNTSFEKDDAFYKEMGMTRTVDLGRNSMNVTLDKQELNEIIQARQKLSLARRGLPVDSEPLPNQVEPPVRSQRSPAHAAPRKSIGNENASELLARRRLNGHSETFDKEREPPKRNATFRRPSPERESVDQTVVYVQDKNIIDINSATMNLVDDTQRPVEEWTDRCMVGSSESTDTTTTCSTASPPDSEGLCQRAHDHHLHVASTPLTAAKKAFRSDLMNLHTTISPILNTFDDKSYTVTKAPSNNSHATYDVSSASSHYNTTVINSATIIRNSAAKRDILSGQMSPEKKARSPPSRLPNSVSHTVMAPPSGLIKKSGLPTSKLRQYSSHKDLRIPVSNGANPVVGRSSAGRQMVRRNVYGSNPALSPTAPAQPPLRRDSYTIATEEEKPPVKPVPVLVRQGTETLRRERPQSQLVQPKDLRGSTAPAPVMRHHQGNSPPSRPYSIAGTAQLRVNRPGSHTAPKAMPVAPEPRPLTSEPRAPAGPPSALPRPSRLPAPRRGLRPPSVYSVAPTADMDHY